MERLSTILNVACVLGLGLALIAVGVRYRHRKVFQNPENRWWHRIEAWAVLAAVVCGLTAELLHRYAPPQ
jgi:hypothetical protein